MVVITVILFLTNVELAIWTVLLVVPSSSSFRSGITKRRRRATLLARDRIANVLADLSESLYGIRVVTRTTPAPQHPKSPTCGGRLS